MSQLMASGSLPSEIFMRPEAHASSSASDRWSLPSPQGEDPWQAPLPPVRFPLRDALLALQDSARKPISYRTASAEAQSAANKGPLLVHSTEKSRALKKVGRMKRRGEGIKWGYAEERPMLTPRAPPECDRPKSETCSVASAVSRSKFDRLRAAQDAGVNSWPVEVEASKSAPDLRSVFDKIRPTWTSAARSVLGHSRRMASERHKGAGDGDGHEDDRPDASLTNDATYCALSLQSIRSLPRSVKDWAGKGMEFTDGGLGVGERSLAMEIKQMASRSPGFIYEQQSFGSVSRWNPQNSQPTKQPSSRHFSATACKMGARREKSRRFEQQPGPGYYDVPGFTDMLLRDVAKRPKPAQAAPSPTASAN
ncbi:unnamed protein product [Polarella glacialis]|uniref:Uncharacterized protein n=1 Tax=Polarella glacialis TaxID=89957 RepID=A0A813FD86_POLGL|nr:unnamed protein product [Polarella glacialis]